MPPFDTKLDVTLRPDRDAYWPGESMLLHVRITAAEATAVRGGRAELVGRLRYQYRTEEWDDDPRGGRRRETRVRTETDEQVLTDSILGPETLAAGETIERWVRFMIPRTALPSGAGEIVGVEWTARATIDVPRRRDASAEREVRVAAPRAAFAARVDPNPRVDPGEAGLELTLETAEVAAGEEIRGTLVVAPAEDFGIRGVRVELMRQETTARDLGHMVATTVLTGEVEIAETELYRERRYPIPFGIVVPPDAAPCHETGLTCVRWFVRVVLDRPRRGDQAAVQEILVHNEPEPADGD
ncbi:MAG: hypothetical protein H0U10_01690 [Chloroflexia bacterium]|nr:hypothetical protein [Chloroflexia bacterium]